MNALRKPWLAGFALALFVTALLWLIRTSEKPLPAPTVAAGTPTALIPPPDESGLKFADGEPEPEPTKQPVADTTPSFIERQKEIDRQHLRALHTAIFAYKKAHGHFPEYLSQLVPDFVEEGTLHSPRRGAEKPNGQLLNHPDPGNEKPSYAFEFSNVVFRDGRTFAEIKEVQRAEWGDAVPILRRFGPDKVMNMSYGGDLYETELNWEWDPATLDVVAARGWGPGLTEGEFTTVQVLGASGQPLTNAQVWTDGRN